MQILLKRFQLVDKSTIIAQFKGEYDEYLLFLKSVVVFYIAM